MPHKIKATKASLTILLKNRGIKVLICPICRQPIRVGDEITRTNKTYQTIHHYKCLEGSRI